MNKYKFYVLKQLTDDFRETEKNAVKWDFALKYNGMEVLAVVGTTELVNSCADMKKIEDCLRLKEVPYATRHSDTLGGITTVIIMLDNYESEDNKTLEELLDWKPTKPYYPPYTPYPDYIPLTKPYITWTTGYPPDIDKYTVTCDIADGDSTAVTYGIDTSNGTCVGCSCGQNEWMTI